MQKIPNPNFHYYARSNGFVLDTLHDCDVYLLDHTSQVQVDDCVNCRIFVGESHAWGAQILTYPISIAQNTLVAPLSPRSSLTDPRFRVISISLISVHKAAH